MSPEGESMRKGRIRFTCPERPGVLELAVRVVERRAGGAGIEITRLEVTREGEARLRSIEASNGGTVPITAEEFDALLGGESERLTALARSETSNLNPFLA